VLFYVWAATAPPRVIKRRKQVLRQEPAIPPQVVDEYPRDRAERDAIVTARWVIENYVKAKETGKDGSLYGVVPIIRAVFRELRIGANPAAMRDAAIKEPRKSAISNPPKTQ
jgi:hypothetical protein